jgi:hypothetical protein
MMMKRYVSKANILNLARVVLRNRLILNVSLVNETLFVEEHDFNPWGRYTFHRQHTTLQP